MFVSPLCVHVQLPSQTAEMVSNVLQLTGAGTEQELDKRLEDALEPNCRVYIHNDDVTPYEFVLIILQRIFRLTSLEAEHVTFMAHTSGIAYVATFPCPEAQRRVGTAHFAASLEGFPLMFTVETEE